jgi:SAM-dependent methyltransferase
MKEAADSWHLTLFSKSVMKQAKLQAILQYLPDTRDSVCLDIGGDNGVISYYLRQRGGDWYSADLTEEAVSSIRELVGANCLTLDGGRTPFEDGFFDLVVIIDFLEHIPDDGGFAAEVARILKGDGLLIVNVPHFKKISLIRPLRLLLGLTDEKHGHLRPGYTREELHSLLEPRFLIRENSTYSRFFSELIDALLSFVYTTFGQGRGKESAKGVLVTGRDVKKGGGMFRLLSMAYPVIWLITRLDRLLFFTRGYSLIAVGRKSR